MKLDLTSLYFNGDTESPGNTASWGTALGQEIGNDITREGALDIIQLMEKDKYKIKFDPQFNDDHHADFKKLSEKKYPFAAVISDVYVNNISIKSPFNLVVAEDTKEAVKTEKHWGRKMLKYNPKISMNGVTNESFYNEVQNIIGVDSCWFAYDISVRNNSLHLSVIKVDDNPKLYKNTIERKNHWQFLLDILHDPKNDYREFLLVEHGLKNEKTANEYVRAMTNAKKWFVDNNLCSEDYDIWNPFNFVETIQKRLNGDLSENWKKAAAKNRLGDSGFMMAAWNRWNDFIQWKKNTFYESTNENNPKFEDDKCDFFDKAISIFSATFHIKYIESFIFSLCSKPFVIITGNSGTGKTKIAESISRWFCAKDSKASVIIAVGADWTDNRAVVGFVNHLRSTQMAGEPGDEIRPVYQSTSILDLMLSANEERYIPHFLILDEMNLSHVERYFSDFLSAMESRNGMIRLHQEGPGDLSDFRLPRFEGDPIGVPREIAYPPNLFVIGTVNIDETTYMFSPKVLDRAHVIEFQVDSNQIADFLNEPNEIGDISESGETAAMEFLQLALNARAGRLESFEGNEKTLINMHLINLLNILKKGRFEFAYRTANEVTRYLRVCRHLAGDKNAWSTEGWKKSLDDEILQKILPRLHGSRNRLGPLLGALACYLHTGDRDAAEKYFPTEGAELASKSIGDSEFRAMVKASALFPRSFAKIKMMSEVLIEEQFVSFIC